ncbi:MAG: SDR family oxidoreductase [Lentisphaeria bacterium]|nr:SDR family oxidoreductase [Lentisphaeria bacterium]
MEHDFLQLSGKWFAVFGVANRKSVAYAVAKNVEAAGAKVIHILKDAAVAAGAAKAIGAAPVILCDVENDAEIAALPGKIAAHTDRLDGFVHSIAFANYSRGFGAFHETEKSDFLQAVTISCFSLIALTRVLKPMLSDTASIVTISISSTKMAAENYGYMAPIKAALDSAVVFLAKSLSADSRVRVNAVGAGLLKTSASAGIPGYVDSYLYAEKIIPRGESLGTGEVADTVTFLLSDRASGINAQTLVVDAGMSINYFDKRVTKVVADAVARGDL